MAQTFKGKPGDLIQIFHTAYQHWAIYIGDNEVVHLVNMGVQLSGSSANPGSSKGKVKREKLTDVVGNHPYQVNNLLDNKYNARDPSVIEKEALAMVGRELKYDIVSYNCEHFANEMRYGKAVSRQVKAALLAGAIGVSGGTALNMVGIAVFEGAAASLGTVIGLPIVAAGVAVAGLFAVLIGLSSSSSSS